jgi:hypothetical protein
VLSYNSTIKHVNNDDNFVIKHLHYNLIKCYFILVPLVAIPIRKLVPYYHPCIRTLQHKITSFVLRKLLNFNIYHRV